MEGRVERFGGGSSQGIRIGSGGGRDERWRSGETDFRRLGETNRVRGAESHGDILHKATVLNKQRQFSESIKLCDQVLSIDPDNLSALLLRSKSESPLDPHKSLESLMLAQALHPGSPLFRSAYGEFLAALPVDRQILNGKIQQIHAFDKFGFLQKAEDLENFGQSRAALDALDRVIDLDSRFPYAYTRKGEIFLALGDKQSASEAFEKALALDAEDRVAANGRLRILGKAPQRSRAAPPKLIEEKLCVICLDGEAQVCAEPCLHKAFCRACVDMWKAKNSTCPICRRGVTSYSGS